MFKKNYFGSEFLLLIKDKNETSKLNRNATDLDK